MTLFKEYSDVRILRVFATALGLFLFSAGGILAARLSPPVKHAEMRVVPVAVPDSDCQAVLDASDKLYVTPFHMYMTQTSAAIDNGKAMNSEMVFAGGARYILYNGKWTPSPLSTQDMKEMDQRNRQNAKNRSCQYARDESVNGEAAALYLAHSESEHGKDDSQIWVSKRQGLLLRQETDLDIGGGRPKTHMSVRYEYNNVQAPKP